MLCWFCISAKSAVCAVASVHRQPFVPLHHATALCGSLYASLHSDCVRLTSSVLAWLGRQPHTQPRHGRRACMPKGSMQGRIQVVEQSRCRTHRQQTTTIAQMQSQQSIHSPSPWGRGFRQGCRNKDTPSFKHGCLQVVEQSRCRTHRQQTTTVAQRQSPQSVLKGIGIED